ncbi:MAG: alpha/beta hydrolase-fold protein [Porphyrobacter sp.]|nr:alpha/beta hydrolase-fold protein [Porphyrobacter sp.]
MFRMLAALFALIGFATPLSAQEQGRFVEYQSVSAEGLPDQRLSIWLPPGYDAPGSRRFPVLYMHDGHNLFDVKNSNFNKIWAADQAMLAVGASGKVEPHIIVGIWHRGRTATANTSPAAPMTRLHPPCAPRWTPWRTAARWSRTATSPGLQAP